MSSVKTFGNSPKSFNIRNLPSNTVCALHFRLSYHEGISICKLVGLKATNRTLHGHLCSVPINCFRRWTNYISSRKLYHESQLVTRMYRFYINALLIGFLRWVELLEIRSAHTKT